MGALLLGAEQLKAIEASIEFAGRPENVYDPKPGDPPPPMKEKHCLNLGTYRAVFTVSRAGDGHLYRHLSVVCRPRRPGVFPGQLAVVEAAKAYGYAGAPGTWLYGTCDCGCQAVSVMQRWQPPAAAGAPQP